MHLSTLFPLAAAAAGTASASALPSNAQQIPPHAQFGLSAINPDSPVNNLAFNAARSSLFVGLPSQNASCSWPDEKFATFYLKDGGLYLYSGEGSGTTQRVFVDRSGMGQGKIGYLTNTSSKPKYAELTGWAINGEENLQFKGADLQACPKSIDGAWSIWAAGFQNPGQNENCVSITAQVGVRRIPNKCVYTK